MINYIQRKRNKKGFTLVELVVVVAILGILAALAIPRFTGTREAANTNTVIANLRSIQSAVELYAAQYNVGREDVNTDQAEAIMGSWPKGPGEAEYDVLNGVPRVYNMGNLPLEEPNILIDAGSGYYYIAQ